MYRTVSLKNEVFEMLDLISRKENCPKNDVVHKALQKYLEKKIDENLPKSTDKSKIEEFYSEVYGELKGISNILEDI